MKEIYLKLMNNFERPCISVKVGAVDIIVLIDTGARFPVWTSGSDNLKKLFPSAHLVRSDCEFSGFGGAVDADIWCFPLVIGKDLIFPTMHALVYETDMAQDLILGIGALKGMSFEIDYTNEINREIVFRVRDDDYFIRNLKLDNTIDGNRIILTVIDKEEAKNEDIMNSIEHL